MCAPGLASFLHHLFYVPLKLSIFPTPLNNVVILSFQECHDPTSPINHNPKSLTHLSFKNIGNCRLRQTKLICRTRKATERTLIGILIASFNGRPSDPRLSLLLGFTRHPGETHLSSLEVSKTIDLVWYEGLFEKLPTVGLSSLHIADIKFPK